MTNQSSEIADDRPSAACEFAPGGAILATGAWSGLVKLWSVPACQKRLTIKAHEDRVTGNKLLHFANVSKLVLQVCSFEGDNPCMCSRLVHIHNTYSCVQDSMTCQHYFCFHIESKDKLGNATAAT